jgi:hypothetical protein
MKTLLAIVATAGICYALFNKGTLPRKQAHETQATAAATTASTPPRAQQPAIPGTLQNLIAEGREDVARAEWEKYLRTAPRVEARGTVIRHLSDGHLLVRGTIGNPKTHTLNHEIYLLFGLPAADRLADGEIFDAFAITGDAIETAGGGRTREYIYVDEGGRRLSRFARNSGVYE